MNVVPEKLISFRVYHNGQDLVGIADVGLPDLEHMTESIKGAGIAGEVESPTLGHFKGMSLSLKWRTIEPTAIVLTQPKSHQIDIRGSQQMYDAGRGEYKTAPIKVTANITPKKTGLGKLEPGSQTDSSTEFEVTYIKLMINGVKEVEIDKFNYICFIHGEDFLKTVREDLGL